MDKKRFLREVFDRLKEKEGVDSDVGLVEVLHTTRNTLESWRARGSVPWEILLDYAARRGVSLDWLLAGHAYQVGEQSGAYVVPPAPVLIGAFEVIDQDADLKAQFYAARPELKAAAFAAILPIVEADADRQAIAHALANIVRLGQ